MVSALSYEISRVSHYSGFILPSLSFRLQDSHLLWSTFPDSSPNLILGFIDNPNPKCITTLGLGSSYFARHYFRNRFYFLFLWVLRCFSSPRSPPYTTLLMYGYIVFFYYVSSLIRISVDWWIFAPPHSFSQLITSFFGSWCLGILPMLFVA